MLITTSRLAYHAIDINERVDTILDEWLAGLFYSDRYFFIKS